MWIIIIAFLDCVCDCVLCSPTLSTHSRAHVSHVCRYIHLPTQGWMFVPLDVYHAGGDGTCTHTLIKQGLCLILPAADHRHMFLKRRLLVLAVFPQGPGPVDVVVSSGFVFACVCCAACVDVGREAGHFVVGTRSPRGPGQTCVADVECFVRYFKEQFSARESTRW